jgi:geranylgeranyl pyrophosphate synthase
LVGKIDLNTPPAILTQAEIAEVEALMRHQADNAHPELHVALDHLLDAGGKRIRPTLGLLTGRMLGAPRQRLVILAAAVELLHTATLVHDDLIDGALLRRSNPTLNAQWSPPATVLTGDLFAWAAKLAADTDHLRLMKLLADTLAVIAHGELTQPFTARGLTTGKLYKRTMPNSLFDRDDHPCCCRSVLDEDTIESMRIFDITWVPFDRGRCTGFHQTIRSR